jgi:hypothetical protein
MEGTSDNVCNKVVNLVSDDVVDDKKHILEV